MRLNVLFLSLILFVSGQVVAQSPVDPADRENPFGIVEGMWLPEHACELGVSWERIIFDWAQHQPEGPDDWNTLNVDDRWLKAANECDREVVAIVKSVPQWATDGLAGAGVPKNLDLPFDDPENYWANFIRKLTGYYQSRGIHRFIILNEPDIDRDTYGFEFEGELEDYFLMLKTAYIVANEVNPAAEIHLAATTFWHEANSGERLYMDRLLERITQDPDAAANNNYFDVFSLHIYFRTETIPMIVGLMRDVLDRNGMPAKPIWINEYNASPNEDPNWLVERPQFQVTIEQQAHFLVQATALALASDVERMAVYKLYDQFLPAGAESFGILTPGEDALPRPAFYTYQTIVEHFDGVVSGEVAMSETALVVRLDHSNGRQTFVAWARTDRPTQISLTASDEKAYLIDQYGGLALMRPDNNAYILNLSGARCDDADGCAIGGEPIILVQSMSENTPIQVTQDDALLPFSPATDVLKFTELASR